MTTLYKVLRAEEWAAAEGNDSFDGSPDDLRDGFIHLSSAAQLANTVDRHFSGETGLMLLSVDAEALGAGLRWEPSSGGEDYPHYYGALPLSAVTEVSPLRSDA